MLRTETVNERTLALLKELMNLPALKDYYLVGGTSLALQYGHRISIDLDFFGNSKLDFQTFLYDLEYRYKHVEPKRQDPPIYQLILEGVKVDLVEYPYTLIKPLQEFDDVRLASPEDIAAMKITAIGTRAAKKDFYDLYFLLENFHLSEIIGFCEKKFPDKDLYHYIRSLIYFDQVENDDAEINLIKQVSWDKVKERILQETKRFMQSSGI